jgi:hypothetical protein
MERTPGRKTLTGVVAAGFLVGGLVVAAPAQGATFGPSWLSCPQNAIMWARGTKGNTGPITVKAGNYSYTDSSKATGVVHRVSSKTFAANSTISGSGATYGYGYCGS